MPTISEITAHALSLPVKSRALLADVLLDSLAEVEIKNYDQIWLDEAKRRDKEISDNKVQCKSHSEVMKNAGEVLKCR